MLLQSPPVTLGAKILLAHRSFISVSGQIFAPVILVFARVFVTFLVVASPSPAPKPPPIDSVLAIIW